MAAQWSTLTTYVNDYKEGWRIAFLKLSVLFWSTKWLKQKFWHFNRRRKLTDGGSLGKNCPLTAVVETKTIRINKINSGFLSIRNKSRNLICTKKHSGEESFNIWNFLLFYGFVAGLARMFRLCQEIQQRPFGEANSSKIAFEVLSAWEKFYAES